MQLSHFLQVRDIVRTASGERMIQWLDSILGLLVRAACQSESCTGTNRFGECSSLEDLIWEDPALLSLRP